MRSTSQFLQNRERIDGHEIIYVEEPEQIPYSFAMVVRDGKYAGGLPRPVFRNIVPDGVDELPEKHPQNSHAYHLKTNMIQFVVG